MDENIIEEKEDFCLSVAESPRHNLKISNEEWFEISSALEIHHGVFYQLWQMGKPIFNEDVPTAGVQFDETGKFIWFHFNPTFWQSLDLYNRLFVICHEALHIILNHGVRTIDVEKINKSATNVALDVVVNHTLINGFGFERSKIINQEKYCWTDTVYKGKKPLPPDNESYEYYYNLFTKVYGHGLPGDGSPNSGLKTVDDHSFMGEKSDKWDDVIDSLSENMTEEEKESLKSIVEKHFQQSKGKTNQTAGTGTGNWVFYTGGKVKKKKKWETVIKNWSKKYLRSTDKDVEQWVKLNRRLALLSKSMFLPSEMEVDEDKEKTKIDVFFFMDTSGSCWNLKDRFFAAAESLPTERFNVRLLCFDTVVQETTLESKKIYGGGGTSFRIMEDFIQKEIANGGAYPTSVWVLTDGYGDKIKPQFPKKWHFFLTPGGVQNYIDSECNFHRLSEYE